MNKRHREWLRQAAAAGVMLARIEHGGRHPHLVGYVNGRRIDLVLAGSPGDWRAGVNERKRLDRAVRGVGT